MARNFFSSLARGFVRSTVNQVGRDTGRIISNSAYGDKHSIPVRHVGSTTAHGSAVEESIALDRLVARPNLHVGTLRMLIYCLLALCVYIVGPVLIIYHGLKRLFRTKITIKRAIAEDIYIPDATAEDGRRFAGTEQYIAKEKAPATRHERSIDRAVGRKYYITGVVCLLFNIYLCIAYNSGERWQSVATTTLIALIGAAVVAIGGVLYLSSRADNARDAVPSTTLTDGKSEASSWPDESSHAI